MGFITVVLQNRQDGVRLSLNTDGDHTHLVHNSYVIGSNPECHFRYILSNIANYNVLDNATKKQFTDAIYADASIHIYVINAK